MRLLNTATGEFRWINSPLDAPYAILSHTWVQDGEQSYQDILAIQKAFRQRASTPTDTLRERRLLSPPEPVDELDTEQPSKTWRSQVLQATRTCISILGAVSVFLWLATHRRQSCPSILWRACDNYTCTFVAPHLDWLEPLLAAVQRNRSDALVTGTGDHRTIQEEIPFSEDEFHSYSPSLDPSSILSSPEVSMKLRNACALARADGYELLWVDSCCIDKTSSAELSEAINSMFDWYSRAGICYVYLADVDDDDVVTYPDSQFRHARWHTRGWTLQELIAPRYLVFFSRNWRPLGTKSTLSRVIEEVTGVDRAILNQEQAVYTASVARRMSWASKRETTRVEDQAYSLLGIFGLHLSTNYGEGRHAFVRLQEAILLSIPDQSIFAWGDSCDESLPSVSDLQFLLAPSPATFASAGQVKPLPHNRVAERLGATTRLPLPEYQTTSYGIRTRFPMIPLKHTPFSRSDLSFFFGTGQYAVCAPLEQPAPFAPTHFAILECEDSFGRLVALPISRAVFTEEDQPADQESKVDIGWVRADTDGVLRAFRTVSLSPADLVRAHLPVQSLDVLIRGQPLLEDDVSLVDSLSPWSMQDESSLLTRRTIRLCDWSRNLLEGQGFVVTHAPRLEGMSNAVNGPFPRTGLFHRKDDIFLLSSLVDGAEDILIRLGRNPEAMEATVHCKSRDRGEWRLVKGGERIFALRAEAANIAWMTFDLPASLSVARRALRMSLHNVTRSFRQYGAIREYFFNLTIELSDECPLPKIFVEAPCEGGEWGDRDHGIDKGGGTESEATSSILRPNSPTNTLIPTVHTTSTTSATISSSTAAVPTALAPPLSTASSSSSSSSLSTSTDPTTHPFSGTATASSQSNASTKTSGTSSATSVSPASGASHSSAHSNIGKIVGGVVGGVAFLALLGLAFFCARRRRRAPNNVEPFTTQTRERTSSSGTLLSSGGSPAVRVNKIPELSLASSAAITSPASHPHLATASSTMSGQLAEASAAPTVATGGASVAAVPSSPSPISLQRDLSPADMKLQESIYGPSSARSTPRIGRSPLSPAPSSVGAGAGASDYAPSSALTPAPAPADTEASRARWYAPAREQEQSRAQSLLSLLSSRGRRRRDRDRDQDSGLRLYNEPALPPPYTAD